MALSRCAVAVLAAALAAACGETGTGDAPRPQGGATGAAIPVTVAAAVARRVETRLDQVGTLRSRREVTVRSEDGGTIVEIRFTEGGPVRRGEVLARLDTRRIEAEISRLEAQILQLTTRAENRRRDLERSRDLLTRELVSRQSFDQIEAATREAEAEIAQARAALASERVLLADATIRAPFDGVAGTRQADVGDVLPAGGAIVTLVDLDPLEIAFQVPEKHKERLALGRPVRVVVEAHPGKVFEGTIPYVSPRVDEETRSFPVKAAVGNAGGRINPGMFARISFATDVRETALTVPAEALVPAEGGSSLFVVEGDAARRVAV